MKQIPYYVVKNGNGFWQPTTTMKALGFESVPCGPDGPDAEAKAIQLNLQWKATKKQDRIKAKSPRMDRSVGYIYFLRTEKRVKIGFSKNPFIRAGGIKTSCSEEIVSMVAVKGTRANEAKLHQRFKAYRKHGEWFIAAAPVIREMTRLASLGEIKMETEVGMLLEHPAGIPTHVL